MAFRVKTTPAAEHDLDDILGWLLAHGSGETGLRWFEDLKTAIASLAELPARCALAPENASVPFEMRQLLYGSTRHRYRILFTIDGGTVYILRIRRPRQRHLSLH